MVRARAFDIVYNMAIHGELLLPTEAGKMAEEMEVSSRAIMHCRPRLPVFRQAGVSPCQTCIVEAVSLLGQQQ